VHICLWCLLLSDAPQLTIAPPSPYSVVVGDQLQINCTATGLPTPSIELIKDGVVVSSSAQNSVYYSIIQTHPDRDVVYTCVAKNNAGNMTHTVYANVIVHIIGMYASTVYDIILCFLSIERGCDQLLEAPENGSRFVIDGFVKYIIFTCNPGFVLKGPSSAMCKNGMWSPNIIPKCKL